jgi:hypothetical protein
MASARIRKSLSAEEILAKTCPHILSDVPGDALGESYYDCNVDNEICNNFNPENA